MSKTEKSLTQLAEHVLDQAGFQVSELEGGLLLEKDGRHYPTLLVRRTLSHKKEEETLMISADQDRVESFIASTLAEDPHAINCVSYLVVKKSSTGAFESLDFIVLPLSVFDNVPIDVKTGDVLSRASGHYWYNFSKYRPLGELFRLHMEA